MNPPIYDPSDKKSSSKNVLMLSVSQVVKPVLGEDGLLKHDFWCLQLEYFFGSYQALQDCCLLPLQSLSKMKCSVVMSVANIHIL